MAEQVALLLADVYGMSDQESAGRLQMPLSGFGGLLDCARNRMIRYAGGRCALVGNSFANAPARMTDADNPEVAGLPDSEDKPAQPIQWKVDQNRLPALRRELLNGLGL